MKNIHTQACAVVLGVTFFGLAALNAANLFFNPDKPTVSTAENRALAELPEFSTQALLDGSYTSDLDKYISDNFVQRENLIKISKTISSYKSITTLLKLEPDVIYIPVTGGNFGDELPADEPEATPEKETEGTPEAPETDPVTPSDDPVTEPDIDDGPIAEPAPDSPLTEPDAGHEQPDITPEQPETGKTDEPDTPPSTSTDIPGKNEAVNPNAGEKDENISADEPDYTVSGYILYNNAVYSIAYMVKSNAQYYANMIDYYASVFPDAQVSCLVAPLSAVTLMGTKMESKINNPEKIIDTIYSYFSDDNVNCVNVCQTMVEHKDEYLYYRSDHHWTDRGAYYAYSDFVTSLGLNPTPLADFEEKILSTSFHGTMYAMTGSEKVKSFVDTLYAYIPTKAQTMTIYPASGQPYSYKSSIMTSYKNYTAFIDGDNPLTIIKTPDSPQDRTIMVIKDSYGNAFTPYLTENFGTVIVVDPRYYKGDLTTDLSGYNLTDIVFLNDAYNPSVKSWTRKIGEMVP